jgi:hypothetical protein
MNIEEFLRAYAECALWSSSGPDEGPHACEHLDELFAIDDLAPECLARMRADCEAFIAAQSADLALYEAKMTCEQWTGAQRAGHDFWLTRNGHGVGFWDRGLEDLGDRLSDATRAFGECYLYPGEDGKVYS